MNISFFTSAHNSVSQRLLIEPTDRGHQVSVANDDQVITLKKAQCAREQIEQAVERLDIEVLFDPNMPHLGSMEVLARIKQDLSRNLHSMTPVKAA